MSRSSSPSTSYHSDCSLGSSRQRLERFIGNNTSDTINRQPNIQSQMATNHFSSANDVQFDSVDSFPPPPPPNQFEDERSLFLHGQPTEHLGSNQNVLLQNPYSSPEHLYSQVPPSQIHYAQPILSNQFHTMPSNQIVYNQTQFSPPNVQCMLPPVQQVSTSQQNYPPVNEQYKMYPTSKPFQYVSKIFHNNKYFMLHHKMLTQAKCNMLLFFFRVNRNI